MRIGDNGIGILQHESKRHFGLKTMKERANSIGGHLFIESEPENGTKISLNIPLNTPQSAIEEVKEEIESVNS